MIFRQLMDRETSTYTYLLADERTKEAVLIDSVREQYERDSSILDELGLTLRYTLETHVHADHVTASGLFRRDRGSKSVGAALGGAIQACWTARRLDDPSLTAAACRDELALDAALDTVDVDPVWRDVYVERRRAYDVAVAALAPHFGALRVSST